MRAQGHIRGRLIFGQLPESGYICKRKEQKFMLNGLIIELLGTYSHRYIVPYNRVNNVTIKVMSSKQINRIRLPTCEVE